MANADKHFKALVQSAKGGNVFDKEEKAVTELISDYFSAERQSEEDSVSEESEEDELEEAEEANSTPTEENEEYVDADDEIVHVVAGCGEGRENMDCNGCQAQAEMLRQAAVFSCNCKYVVTDTATGEEADPRVGCIRQFSNDEITAIQLSIKDMDRGKTMNNIHFLPFTHSNSVIQL